MKYKKYIVFAFLGALFLPLLSAKSDNVRPASDNLKEIVFLEQEPELDLGFDTQVLLPDGFDPFTGNIAIETINFIEDDTVELGFDTAEYLPENFDPYVR